MKFLFYLLALAAGIALGFSRGLLRRTWWRAIAAVVLIGVGILGALQPPTVGTFRDAILEAKGSVPTVTVLIPQGGAVILNDTLLKCTDYAGTEVLCIVRNAKAVMAMSKHTKTLLTGHSISHNMFSITYFDDAPVLMLPHIPTLGEKARIMYFHVPSAWAGFFAFVVTMIFSVRYLRRGRPHDDTIAYGSALVGTLFTALAYISGAIWAKFNWGKFFNWDTRELSVLLLLAIYAAYFVLRANTPAPARYRLAAVYAIVASIAALFLIFIVPRITVSLHPGSKDDVNIGPILSPEQDALDLTKAAVFSIMLAGFTVLYSWMLSITARYHLLRQRIVGQMS
ncbi:Cytochrome c biogenesis protein CcsA [bacterium HR20]|nr:Cytochrome c biogenesis protein CcsA [bacterium HR20]